MAVISGSGKGIQIVVGADYTGKELQRAINDLERVKRQTQTTGKKLAAFGQGMSTIGKNLSLYVSLPLAAAAAAAVAFSTEFGKSMANVATLIPENTGRVEDLKDELLDLGPEVGKSLNDLSGGLYQVISAFGDTADTVTILETNARAATAGMASTTDAINLTSAVTKAYGDTSATAVEQVSDLALLAVRLGQTTFPELAASIGRVTPLAAELGVTQEELFASMATLTGVTGGAAEVSTQLRGALQALLAPTADTTRAFKDAGIESGTALIQQEGLAGAILFLVDAAERSGQPLQKYIGSIEGQTVALALAGAQGDEYTRKLGEMERASGTTTQAFEAATTGVGETAFTFEQLRAEGERLLVNLGDGIAPALMAVLDAVSPLIDMVSGLAEQFTNLDPGMQAFVVFLAGAVILVGPLLAVLGTAIRTVQTLQAALIGAVGATNALKAALISSGIGAAIVVIGSVIAALAVSNSQADQEIRNFNESIRDQNGLLRDNAIEMSRKRLEERGYLDIAQELGINQYDLAKAYAEGGDQLDQYIAVLQPARDEIDGNRKATHEFIMELERQRDVTNEASAAQYDFRKATDEAQRETNEFRGKLDAQRNALNNNEDAVDGNTSAYDEMNGVLDETIDRFLTVNGLLDDTRAVLDYEQSWIDFGETLDETGISFDGTTEAGQAFQRSLNGLVDNLLGVLDTQDAVGNEAGIVEQAIRDLDAEVNLMGMDPEARAKLLEPFKALLDDLAESDVNVTQLQRLIDKLEGKTVRVKVLADYTGLPSGISKQDLVGIGMATGGLVRGRGGPMADLVPAMLSSGEFVVRAQAVNSFGPDFFAALNRGINPLAGMDAPRMSDRSSGPSRSMVIENINVTAASNEPAEVTVPRALRRLAWVSGLDG
jgi:TP901 family phage tail tape measure protein